MTKKITTGKINYISENDNIFFITKEFSEEKSHELISILRESFGLKTTIVEVDSDYEATITNFKK